MITEERLHRVALPAYVIERIAQRRSSAHAFERIDPVRTALVVVDLQNGFMAPGQPAEIPVARAIVPNVNRLAEATREAGGTVVWIKNTFDQEAAQTWTVWRTSFATGDWGQRMEEAFTPGNFGHELYAGLKTAPVDLVVLKRRFSALVQGSSGLDPHDSPHFHTTPKVSANTGSSASMAVNRSISGNSRACGILGIRS